MQRLWRPDRFHQVHAECGGRDVKRPIESREESTSMDRYVCQVCGYVYDPEAGDPDNGVPKGTKFKDLPDDWTCPVCGASKDQFEKE